MKTRRIFLTGDENTFAPSALPGRETTDVEWTVIPLLAFEKIPVDPAWTEEVRKKPFEWVIFTSPRSVRFWSDLWIESGSETPLETQIACIGEKTAEVANLDGFHADFYPTEPGTETFLAEFRDLVDNNPVKPTICIPGAEAGRPDLRHALEAMGCQVTWLPLYRTVAAKGWEQKLSPHELEAADLLVFTSPSSFTFFSERRSLPEGVPIAAIGEFTRRSLLERGVESPKLVPAGDLRRAPELLERS